MCENRLTRIPEEEEIGMSVTGRWKISVTGEFLTNYIIH
jgi:hypothetical protein